ncbi:MAG: hypothetical protein K0S32_4586 [Bacteroidetes bacterium]|jgi:hypothetical protein|nr:hypothetical protein [Bacteroidota bacterium]
MFDDIKKTIGSILYERAVSPFYGTFLCSWIIWNWKIVYLTLFVSEKKLSVSKLDYITTNLFNTNYLLIYPLISTIVLLTILPFVSNAAYWMTLRFSKWRKDQKKLIENKQLITLEQSIELREQILNQEARFEKLLENKNLEIQQLKSLIEEKEKSPPKTSIKDNIDNLQINSNELEELSKRIKNNPDEKREYENMIFHIQKGYQMGGNNAPSTEILALMESYDVIRNIGSTRYQLTEAGKKFHRLMSK